MRKGFFLVIILCSLHNMASPQEIFITRQGQVSFFSKTPLENIEAVNNAVASVLNMQTGEIAFSLLIKSFHFERALMEEHFNENYMDSDKIPKAGFKGKIINAASVVTGRDGSYPVTVEGDLTIHGVTRNINLPGTIVVKAGQLQALASFTVAPGDYNIRIPSLVTDKIANSIRVSVNCRYSRKG